MKRPFEELRRCRKGRPPVPPQQSIVDVVRKNEFVDFDALVQQPALEIDGLMKLDGTVVVSVNEQDRGFPGAHRRDR